MMTALGAMLILGACATLGMAARSKMRKRISALSAMLDAMAFVRAEIEGPHTPLPDVVDTLAHSNNPDQRRVFREMCKRIEKIPGMSLGYHWSSTIRDFAEEMNFGPDATAVLRDASSFLGRYDVSQQLQCITYAISRLETCRQEACTEYRKHGGIYRTCGIAGGIFIVLILI